MFPFIPLEKALDRAREFWDKETRNAAPVSVAASDWGYKKKSSGGLQTVSALKSFGLMEDVGTGDNRKVKLTERARRVILDKQAVSTERDAEIKSAALSPKIHAEVWHKWGANLPSDETFRTYLVRDRCFNEGSADAFIRQYKDTLAFAKLGESDSVSDEAGDSGAGEEGAHMENLPTYGATSTSRSPKPPVTPPARGEDERLRFNLSGGRAVRLIFAGPPPTQAEIDELMDYLKVSKRTFPTEPPSDGE